MRKFTCLSMAVMFLVTIVTGFAENHVHPGDSGHHTVLSLLFVVSVLVHCGLNFRALSRYLTSPAKKTTVK